MRKCHNIPLFTHFQLSFQDISFMYFPSEITVVHFQVLNQLFVSVVFIDFSHVLIHDVQPCDVKPLESVAATTAGVEFLKRYKFN